MTPDHTAAAWDYIHDRLAIIEAQCKSTSTTFQKEVVEPFDKLLEKKADYYLKTEAEKGAAPEWLGKEIEVLDRFRRYVEILESHTDERMSAALYLAQKQQLETAERMVQMEWLFDCVSCELHDVYQQFIQLLESRKCQSQQ